MKSIGRAEYETVNSCFEETDAKVLLGELYNTEDGRKRKKMIIGDTGTGKTHLCKLFSKEEDIDLYILNKDALFHGEAIDYQCIHSSEKPKFAILDDIHYLLKGIDFWKDYKDVGEKDVIKTIENFEKRYGDDVTKVYIADETPTNLSYYFQEEKKIKKFLKIMPVVAKNSFDCARLKDYTNRIIFPEGKNLIDLNDRISGLCENNLDIPQKLADKFNVKDIPVGFPSTNHKKLVTYRLDYDDNILQNEASLRDIKTFDLFSPHHNWRKSYIDKSLLTTRQLKVLGKELNEISRKSLNIENLGGNFHIEDWRGNKKFEVMYFTPNEMNLIRLEASKKFYRILDIDWSNEINALWYGSDEDYRKVRLLQEMEEER